MDLFFYQYGSLALVLNSLRAKRLFRAEQQVLAQVSPDRKALLAADQAGSVLRAQQVEHQAANYTYTAFGADAPVSGDPILPGYNGERREINVGCYLLGNGHRTFSPVLMRFLSSDRHSPFEKGGINSYAYCKNDPVNYTDASGRVPNGIQGARRVPSVGNVKSILAKKLLAKRGANQVSVYPKSELKEDNLREVLGENFQYWEDTKNLSSEQFELYANSQLKGRGDLADYISARNARATFNHYWNNGSYGNPSRPLSRGVVKVGMFKGDLELMETAILNIESDVPKNIKASRGGVDWKWFILRHDASIHISKVLGGRLHGEVANLRS